MARFVLVVDDNRRLAKMLAEFIQENGFDAFVAGSVREALIVSDGYPQLDFLITDYDLGDGTGVDLARGVRRGHPDIEVIITSGTPRDVPADMNFIQKPMSLANLLQFIRRH